MGRLQYKTWPLNSESHVINCNHTYYLWHIVNSTTKQNGQFVDWTKKLQDLHKNEEAILI